jgi:hypothetical protein
MGLSTAAAVGRLARVQDPAGLLYGALVAASVLGTAATHGDFGYVALATGLVLAVYWLAHVYIEAQALQLHGDARRYAHLLGHTAVREASVIQGGLPAIVVYAVSNVLGATAKEAAAIAVYFSVGVLFVVGFLTARIAGRTGLATWVDAVAASLLGVAVIVAKALLH